jgi:hypothetical protein
VDAAVAQRRLERRRLLPLLVLGRPHVVMAVDQNGRGARRGGPFAVHRGSARIRRAVRARGHVPNGAAALTRVYLAVMSLDATGQGAAGEPCGGNQP